MIKTGHEAGLTTNTCLGMLQQRVEECEEPEAVCYIWPEESCGLMHTLSLVGKMSNQEGAESICLVFMGLACRRMKVNISWMFKFTSFL